LRRDRRMRVNLIWYGAQSALRDADSAAPRTAGKRSVSPRRRRVTAGRGRRAAHDGQAEHNGLALDHRHAPVGIDLARGRQVPRSAGKRQRPIGTTFSFALNEPAAVTLSFASRSIGRGAKRVKHRGASLPHEEAAFRDLHADGHGHRHGWAAGGWGAAASVAARARPRSARMTRENSRVRSSAGASWRTSRSRLCRMAQLRDALSGDNVIGG
jgi:hypothetical protein